jgi:predicted solute-binding protein
MIAKARLGRIAYLNVLPIYFALENILGENGFHLVRGTPAELNGLMRRGQVDLGSISAMEYGRAFRDYFLLPDLSISSKGAVGSVLLFSRVPFSRLDGRLIRVSAASASGAALVKVLMAELFEVAPRYQTGQLAGVPLGDAAAVMAIGDEALRCPPREPAELDLGRPGGTHRAAFVFGVTAVRGICRAAKPPIRCTSCCSVPGWGPGVFGGAEPGRRTCFGMTPAGLAYFRQLNYSGPGTRGRAGHFNYLYNLGELDRRRFGVFGEAVSN